MRKYLLYLILLTGLFGCNFPTELSVSGSTKPADKFSRTFIDKIISGQTESAFADIDPDVLNDKAKEFITNASRNINGATPKKYRVVETNWTSGVFTKTGKFTNYRLGYEYEFEQGETRSQSVSTASELSSCSNFPLAVFRSHLRYGCCHACCT